MKALSFAIAAAVLLLSCAAGAPRSALGETPRAAFQTGKYRNLLAERGHSEKEIDERLKQSFQQLFHGDAKTEAIYYDAGTNANGPLGYVTDVANHDARTEGMSYGMMIAVQTGHKAEFDAIWNWANTYMLITDPKNPAVGYFAWSMNTDGTPRSVGPAPDGEEYFVMSLYFAAHRWGNGKGLYDYQAQADRLLSLLRHHPVLTAEPPFRIHPEDAAPAAQHRSSQSVTSVGPMVNEANTMVVFVPSSGGNEYSDASYHLPAFYELWARWGPADDREFWAKAAKRSRQYFTQVTNPATGLAPDYSNFDGTPHPTAFNPMAGNSSFDSWRVVSNWSVDEAWWGSNDAARGLSDRLQHFLAGRGVHTFPGQYTLEGKPLSSTHAPGIVATVAVGSLVATHGATADAFVDELWDTPIPKGQQRYYDGMLYMMSLLHVSGRFRIW